MMMHAGVDADADMPADAIVAHLEPVLETLRGADLPGAHSAAALCAKLRAVLPSTGLVSFDAAVHELAVNTGAAALEHPDNSRLAGRIVLWRHNVRVRARLPTFEAACRALAAAGVLNAAEVAALSAAQWADYGALVDAAESRVHATTDVFSIRTLQQSYLLRLGSDYAETPAMMYMRVALGIHGVGADADTRARVVETFDALTCQRLSHATPTMFNAWTTQPQLASCFLMQVRDDSIEGIYGTLLDCAKVSKFAGGIGLSVSGVRARGAPIGPTRAGGAGGLVPMLRVFSDAARHVDQGGGKRKGSIAIYLEPWHADIMDWLGLKRDLGGMEDMKARDLFYGLWVPDLFMRRVRDKAQWSLFCPAAAPGLNAVCGAEFDALYTRYEAEGRAKASMPALELMEHILAVQAEVGTPYFLFKDACNRYSNQQHLGVIQCANLCCEVVQYTAPGAEVATCNLAAIVLDAFVVSTGTGTETDVASAPAPAYDFAALEATVRVAVRNVDRIIDRTLYPLPECRASNLAHRPMGIGVIGLADALARLHFEYGEPEAIAFNRDVFETLYYAAVSESVALAERAGAPYPSFAGSPFSRGELQFDLRGVAVSDARHDWSGLKAKLRAVGARNSLLTALMPTASTAQIVGRNESFEPFGDLMGSRRVLAGDYVCVNRHMVRDLEALGLWTPEVRASIRANRGSLQRAPGVPDALRRRYLTCWEIPHRKVLLMSIARSPFVDQAASNNVHMANPSTEKLGSALFFAWENGEKVGGYYTRRLTIGPIPFAALADKAAAVVSATAAVPEDMDVDDDGDGICTSCTV
jgi:ribonucleoside-diphosphate reductase alpha subunit